MSTKQFYSLFTLALAMVCLLPVLALAEDTDDPIIIEADALEYDNQTGQAVYTGNVQARQGARVLEAEELVVHRSSNGDIERLVAKGEPAHFRMQTDTKKPPMHAESYEIEYLAPEQCLWLKKSARVEQGGDIYQAPEIQYDIAKETVSSAKNDEGRTMIVLQPKTTMLPFAEEKEQI